MKVVKIYTKTGDRGYTKTRLGKSVRKDSAIIKAYGDIDELISIIALVVASCDLPFGIEDFFMSIKGDLVSIIDSLESCSDECISPSRVESLESDIDSVSNKLGSVDGFIWPANSRSAAFCNLARAVCRRAERSIVELDRKSSVDKRILCYVNRLSDVLFVVAKWLSSHHRNG